jgi:hypothetical protein
VLLDDRLYPDKRLDVGVEPVGHQLELTVRWNKRNCSVILEPTNSGLTSSVKDYDKKAQNLGLSSE